MRAALPGPRDKIRRARAGSALGKTKKSNIKATRTDLPAKTEQARTHVKGLRTPSVDACSGLYTLLWAGRRKAIYDLWSAEDSVSRHCSVEPFLPTPVLDLVVDVVDGAGEAQEQEHVPLRGDYDIIALWNGPWPLPDSACLHHPG